MIHASVVGEEEKEKTQISAGKQRHSFSDIWFWVMNFSSFLFVLEEKEGKTFWSQHLRGKK